MTRYEPGSIQVEIVSETVARFLCSHPIPGYGPGKALTVIVGGTTRYIWPLVPDALEQPDYTTH